MKKTGEFLKQKREGATLSLSEVALATKINPKILAAIESGDEAHLPAKTFLKGFVRSYAIYLKCDVDEVLKIYIEETGGSQVPRSAAPEPARASENSSPLGGVNEESSAGMRTTAVIGIVILIGLIIGVRELSEKYQREKIIAGDVKVTPLSPAPSDAPSPPTSSVTVPPPSAGAAAPSSATASPAAKEGSPPLPPVPPPSPPPQVKAPVQTVQTPPSPSSAPPPAPAPFPSAQPRMEPGAKTSSPPVASSTGKAAAPAPGKPKEAKFEVILEALDKVDVKFKVHGEARSFKLDPSQVHTIHSDEPIVLDVSDGGAVNVIVNGRERGPLGELGKSASVSVP